MEDILLTLQKNHDRNNSANGGHYLGCRDLKLLPMFAGHLCGLVGHFVSAPWCPNYSYLFLTRGFFVFHPNAQSSSYTVPILLYSRKHWWDITLANSAI